MVVPLDPDAGIDLSVLERLDHAGFSRVCKGAVIFAEVAAEAPLLIHVNSFHRMPVLLSEIRGVTGSPTFGRF